MPFVLLFVAVLLVAIGMRGQAANASKLLASEFTGTNSFVPWFLAIMVLGLIGYWKPAKAPADALLLLMLLAIVLAKGNPGAAGGGLFAQLNAAFKNAQPTPTNSGGTATTPATASPTPGATAPASPSLPNTPYPFGTQAPSGSQVYPNGWTLSIPGTAGSLPTGSF